MYRNVGWRNQQAINRQGNKVLEIWKDDPELRHMYLSYKSALEQTEILMRVANLIVNR